VTPDAGAQARLRLVWAAYGLSGAAALADEVVWTRFLQLVLGSSVYATSAMLAALMAGLAIGGWIGARRGDRVLDPARAVAWCEIATGATALLSLAVLRVLPALHLKTFQRFQLAPTFYFALDLAVCVPAVLVPTILMGLTFPLVARLAHEQSPDRVAATVGGAYTANTIGAIGGAALAGFALVPAFGLWGTLIAAAGANAGAALFVLAAGGKRVRPLGAAVVLLLAAGLGLAARPPPAVIGYHLAGRVAADPDLPARLAHMTVLFDRWAPQGRVEVLEEGRARILVVDGRIEGASRGTEHTTQDLLALAPGALRGAPSDVFAIGLGTGRTLVTLLDVYRGSRIEVAEVNPAVVEAVHRFFREDLRRHVTVADGRRLLTDRPGPYDAIVSGPSFPVDGTSGSLFTREFFQLARARLRPRGVLAAWVPGYLLEADELRALIATATAAFPHLALWRVRANDDLVLLASPEPFDDADLPVRLARLDEPFWLTAGVIEPVLHPPEVGAWLAAGGAPRLHRDLDPWLELAMARNLVRGRTWLAP